MTFRVTFSDDVARVSTDDFSLNGTAAADGTIAAVTRISDAIYDVKVTGLTNSSGTVNLDVKGVDGSGSNNIIKGIQTQDATNTASTIQHSDGDTFIWQSFTAENTGLFNSVTLRKAAFTNGHSYEGTAILRLYTGEGTSGTLLATQNINVTSSTGDVTYVFETPASVTVGQQYTWYWEQGTGSGKPSFVGQTGNFYAGGRGLSQQFPSATSVDWYFITQVITDTSVTLTTTIPATDETYTISNPPSVTTTTASNITNNSATLAGNVTASGKPVTERGVVYSTTDQTPEIGETGVTKDTNGSGLGVFSEAVSGLTSETTYYYRAYATNSDGTGYGDVMSFTTLGVSVTSITRQNPTTQDLVPNSATFQVTFSKPVQNVDITDFTTNSAGATIGTISAVSTSQYNVTVNNITSFGDVFLQIKGVDGVTGSNNITTLSTTSETTTVDQQNSNDYLNQYVIGQTFIASTNGIVKSVTFYPQSGQHTFSGTADLRLYSGNYLSNGSLFGTSGIDSETVTITNSTDSAGQTFTFTTPVTLTAGNSYTITLVNFSGSGNHALQSHTSNQYNDGHVIFGGMNSSSHLDFDLKIKIIEEATTVGSVALSTTAPTTNEKFIKIQTSGIPFLTTADATSITKDGATLGGEIISQGNSAITERGIVYSTTSSFPVIGETGVTKDDNGSGTGVFSEAITGLDTKSIFFYRAYAINTQGTGYGKVKKFSLNNALALEGSDDRVEIPNYNYTNGFSFDALLKPVTFSGNPTFLSRHGSSNTVFAFIIKSDGTVECTISTNGTTESYFTTTASLTLNTWQHVAFTYNNADGAMKFYINGTDAGAGSVTNATSGALFNSSNDIQIGARNSSLHYEGAIDELRIWNKTLSETFINQIKNKVVPKNANGLLAYYQFNQGIAGAFNGGHPNLITQVFNTKTGTLDGDLINFSMNGTRSNFIEGATGDFNNNVIVQNRFTTTGNWSNSSNWSLGIVPNKVENVIISQNQMVTIDVDDLEIDDFELETGATLDIPKNKEITINNAFTSNGNLSLQSDKNDSGVLLLNGDVTGTITYKRGGLLANEWSLVTPPVSGQTVKTFAENASNNIRTNTGVSPTRYAIGYYDDAQAAGSKWQYYDANVNAATEFVAGQSYIVSRATDGEVTFTGTLTADNVFKTLVADQWNAIGNPFTTYYPANKNSSSSFLNDNMDALDDSYKSLYLWDNDQNRYVAVSEVDATDRSLPPGQGFFVRMKTGQTEINFQEAKRSTKPTSGNTTFSKSVTPEIILSLSDENTSVKTNIKYFANATLGLDPGYDIGNFGDGTFDIFTKLVVDTNTNDFTIQSLPLGKLDHVVIPVGIVAKKEKEIAFSIEKLNFPEAIHIYLEDTFNKTLVELNTNNNYTVQLENDVNGTGRFFIHTSSRSLSTNENSESSGVAIFTNNKRLKINGLQSEKSVVTLFSLVGQKIYEAEFFSQGNKEIDIANLATGIYLVRLQSETGRITKKIVIE